MKKIVTGVVGSGKLGGFHAQKYASNPSADFAGVFDTDRANAEKALESAGIGEVFDSPEKLYEKCDAVSIAVPTSLHYEEVNRALDCGCHVLVEKPIASESAGAEELIQKAEKKGLRLFAGHIERFNSSFRFLEQQGGGIKFIEAHRLAGFNPRGLDVPVVMDLMIHDIDLVLKLAGKMPVNIAAAGVPVVSPDCDIANARLEFPDGMVANLTASRISASTMRKFRVFRPNAYYSLDMNSKEAECYEIDREHPESMSSFSLPPLPDGRRVWSFKPEINKSDQLYDEIDAFLKTLKGDESGLLCTGEEALRALRVGEEIMDSIKKLI
ncbi:MAG: Gfo/Idh/MocA family oxidoreductase [Fibrobacterota bacterium]